MCRDDVCPTQLLEAIGTSIVTVTGPEVFPSVAGLTVTTASLVLIDLKIELTEFRTSVADAPGTIARRAPS